MVPRIRFCPIDINTIQGTVKLIVRPFQRVELQLELASQDKAETEPLRTVAMEVPSLELPTVLMCSVAI